MSEHTKEPWAYEAKPVRNGYVFVIESDMISIGCCYGSTNPMWDVCGARNGEANARRIVACVNACAGIPTEDLESRGFLSSLEKMLVRQRNAANEQVSVIAARLDAIEKQRDELAKALEEISKPMMKSEHSNDYAARLRFTAITALANVKGEKE